MKYIVFVYLIVIPALLFAGGNTAIVEISKLKSIEISDQKITLRGEALTTYWIYTTKEHSTRPSVRHSHTQTVYSESKNAEFVVVPYFSKEVTAINSGGHTDQELEEYSKRWWIATLERAKTLKAGDAVRIGYQGSKISIDNVSLTKVIGCGGISKIDKIISQDQVDDYFDRYWTKLGEEELENDRLRNNREADELIQEWRELISIKDPSREEEQRNGLIKNKVNDNARFNKLGKLREQLIKSPKHYAKIHLSEDEKNKINNIFKKYLGECELINNSRSSNIIKLDKFKKLNARLWEDFGEIKGA